jgi:hypothetical protein
MQQILKHIFCLLAKSTKCFIKRFVNYDRFHGCVFGVQNCGKQHWGLETKRSIVECGLGTHQKIVLIQMNICECEVCEEDLCPI